MKNLILCLTLATFALASSTQAGDKDKAPKTAKSTASAAKTKSESAPCCDSCCKAPSVTTAMSPKAASLAAK
jgi:hypothetical protein